MISDTFYVCMFADLLVRINHMKLKRPCSQLVKIEPVILCVIIHTAVEETTYILHARLNET